MQDLSQMSTEELLRMRNAAQQGQPAAPARAPGVIRGPQARVNQVDQQRLDMEERRLQLSEQSEARQQQQQIRQSQQQEQGFDATEGERKAAAFLLRALGSNATYEKTGVGPRGLLDQAAKDAFPNVTNYFTSGERQAAESAQDEFIAASLRQDSGAAIPEEELERQRRIYFPMPGDGPEALEQKRQARLRAIAGLEQSAGRLLPQTQDEWARMSAELGINSPVASEGDGQSDDGILRGRVTDVGPPRPGDPGYGGDGGGGQFMTGLAQGTGDIVQGVGDTIGVFTDPFARVLADTLGFDGANMPSLGTRLREGVGLPQSPEGVVRNVNEFAAGGFAGGVAARGLGAIASPGVTQGVLRTLGRTPVRDTAAAAGAGAGASIGENLGGTPGQVAGIVLGGLSGNALANRLANVAAGGVPNALAQAAQRQGVDLLPADTGGPVARAVTTGTRASPISVAPVVAAAERQQQQFGQAVRRTAATQGEVVDTQAAGETIQRGAQEFSRQTSERGSRLYDRAAQQARGVRAIRPIKTVGAVEAAIARMRDNPAASPSEIASLEAFRDNIANGVSIQGLRDARTTLSQGVYDGKLRSSADQAMWKNILGNVADDIDAGLRSVGREDAANTFRAADRFWQQRVETIDNTLAPIVGKDGMKGGEEVLQAIERMARGGSGGNLRLGRLMAALPEAEAGNVRATLIDRLGRATPGAQDAQGEAFSASTFLTNWNKMTPQAKASMFPDKAARDNLNDLATIAEQTKRSQAMANTSNTGVAVTSANLAAGVGGAALNLPATLLAGGSVYLSGRLMASPAFARLLARTSKMSPETANRTFVEQLGVLSTRNPELSGDLDNLMRAVNDNNAGALAAEEQNP